MNPSARCPRCGTSLTACDVGQRPVHGCASCGGVWLGRELAQQVVLRALDAKLKALVEQADRAASVPLDESRPMPCPECQRLLERSVVSQARIELDSCGEHGTWFDHSELTKLSRQLAIERAYGARGPSASPGHPVRDLAALGALGTLTAAGAMAAVQATEFRDRPRQRNEVGEFVADLGEEVVGEELLPEAAAAAIENGVDLGQGALELGAEAVGGGGGAAAVEVLGAVAEVGGTVLEGALSVLGAVFEGLG